MEKFQISEDITVLCIKASSFPEGVLDAHKKMHSVIPFTNERKYFGISRPNKTGAIEYYAAAEKLKEGEAEQLKPIKIILKAGEYISIVIPDYLKDVESITRSFAKLLTVKDIDPNGYCVEFYYNSKDVRCMIRLKG